LKQLSNIEVYQTEQVIVEWVVKMMSGDIYHGRADARRVASKLEEQVLKLFLTEEDLESKVPPLELLEELAKLGEILDPKRITLLPYLLMQDDLPSIENTLQRRGISNEVPEFDSNSG
jgi:hypothetical protein